MQRRFLISLGFCLAVFFGLPATLASAADEAPDALITRLTQEAIALMQADSELQAGNVERIVAVMDQKVMPHVNFARMTASAVGPAWRQATPEQRQQLQAEFKTLLVRTYSGAMGQIKDLKFVVKPVRYTDGDQEVVVQTQILGRGDPVQLDYRLERTPGQGAGWKIFNLNVLGIWLVETYRSQFAQQINNNGIDGLIAALAQRNKTNAAGSKG